MVSKQQQHQNEDSLQTSETSNVTASTQQQPQHSRRSSGKILGSVAIGLRKTKNKTYSALRVGGNLSKAIINDVKEEEAEEENEEYEVEYSHQAVGTEDLNGLGGSLGRQSQTIFTPRSSRGSEGELLRSRSRGSVGDRPLYFSPQASWRDIGKSKSFGIATINNGNVLSPGGYVDVPNEGVEEIVRSFESILRKVVVCSAFFLAGTIMPERAPLVNKVLELTSVAWGTCLVIVALAWFQGRGYGQSEQFAQSVPLPLSGEAAMTPEQSPVVPSTAAADMELSEPPTVERRTHATEEKGEQTPQRSHKRNHDEVANSDSRSSHKIMRESVSPVTLIPKQHKQLEDLYVMMTETNERIFPNTMPFKLDNALFSGEMLLLFRTSEADEPIPEGATDSDPIVRYFRGKQRRFEFQWQFKLKKVPDGDVFVCCELDEPVRLGMIQRTLVNTVLKFVKKTNQGFSYYLSDTAENPSYLSFPVGTSMDRFCATKPGESVPKLGNEVIEDPDFAKKRKKGMKIEWNTEDVYTLALWSAYFDWLDWQILNFPGIRPFSATSVAGVQPIKLTLYSVSNSGSNETVENVTKHDKLISMEISNQAKSTLGTHAKKWKTNPLPEKPAIVDEDISKERSDSVETNNLELSNRSGDPPVLPEDSSVQDEDDIDENSDDEEEPIYFDATNQENLDDIDISSLLVSGIPISLQESTGNYVASGGGYAVLQSSPTSTIVLEKVIRSKKTSLRNDQKNHRQMVIHSGDIVRVKLVPSGDNQAARGIKYLSIHRGWWLKWTSQRPKNNGTFYIRSQATAGDVVHIGQPFSLESRRWSHYLVGVCVESSTKFGGRMLGIYKKGKTSQCDEPFGEDDDLAGDIAPDEGEKSKNNRMVPLLLYSESISSPKDETITSSPVKSPRRARLVRELSSAEDDNEVGIPDMPFEFPEKRYNIDAPAWIEMMNRTKRTKQLVYVIRVEETGARTSDEAPMVQASEAVSIEEIKEPKNISRNGTYVKLRAGHDLAPILRLGLECRRALSPSDQMLQIADLDDDGDEDEDEDEPMEQQFDFSEQVELERAETFSSSSEDSDSDDEALDFVIAGPNHDDNGADAEVNENGDSFAKIWPDQTEEQTDCAVGVEGSCKNTEKGCTDGISPETPFESSLSVGTKKAMSIGRRSRSLEREFHEPSPSSTFTAVTQQPDQLFATTPNLDSEDSSRKLPQYDSDDGRTGDVPKIPHLESIDAFDQKKKKTKHAAVLTRVAKTVKSSTVITGKNVIKQGKKVGKGTVSAGKAAGRVIPVSSVVYAYKPPTKHEPGRMKRPPRSQKDHKNSLRTVNKALKSMKGQSTATAASMLPPEESCRKISNLLSAISSDTSQKGQEAISLLLKNDAKDLAFLRGSSAELGVVPIKQIDDRVDVECIVARCIWDSHWREEVCALYPKAHHCAFYAPLTKKPSLVLSFEEIIGIRKCNPASGTNPLPGLHMLSIDTSWRCHYLAFAEETERDSFLARINDALFRMSGSMETAKKSKYSPEWEQYQQSLETSLTGLGIQGKWAPVPTGKKSKQKKPRRILNGRRMAFDVDHISKSVNGGNKNSDTLDVIAAYVEKLLKTALSFSPDALTASQSSFMEFLDEVSRLRLLPLHEIDLNSKGAFCIFVNIYHCLLQHALLLAVDGLPNKRSVVPFKRCSCYEIGGDVFSLSDLECHVIRGKTSRAVHPKPPFVDGAKKSRAFMQYALGATDHRINFLLNNGDLAYPAAVPVLQSTTMEEQIEASSSSFLKAQVKIDKKKRTVFLPKVCDVYRNDFGMGDGLVCLSQCIKYLNDADQLTIAALLSDGVGSIAVKFRAPCEQFHSNLTGCMKM